MVTGGSWSVWQAVTFAVFSRAGAAGRIALIEVGAKLFGVPTQQCLARNSALVAADQRSISYAEIVRRGDLRRTFTPDELAKMPIKPASERHLIGRKVDALDIPPKTNGTATTGSTLPPKAWSMRGRRFRRPAMARASVRSTIPPPGASRVTSNVSPSRTRPGWTNSAVETFMDEAAHAVGADPVAFRSRMLDGKGRNAGSAPNSVGGAKRQAAVLQRAAQKGNWGASMPKDSGLGVATTFGQERDMPTWVACVARVWVDRGSGWVVVEKLTIVVDAGTVVDPDGALAQVEGGALWGLSMALHEGTEFVRGQVKDTNLDTYTPLRMGDAPELDIEFIDSTEVPVGFGEPGTTVLAPAIGNAIFAAVGARLRGLPIRPAAVLHALASKS